MDDRVGPAEGVERLAEIGQIGDQALAVRAAVVTCVHVQDVVTRVAKVAHDPLAALARPARDHDPHRLDLPAKYAGLSRRMRPPEPDRGPRRSPPR